WTPRSRWSFARICEATARRSPRPGRTCCRRNDAARGGSCMNDPRPSAALLAGPPVVRGSMAPTAPVFESARRRGRQVPADSPDPRGHWHRAGVLRRGLLFGLVVAQTILATYFMSGVLPYQGGEPLEVAILALFALLFAWLSAGFWTALAGF